MADGSQFLITHEERSTTRGETQDTTHSQDVTYNDLTDTATERLDDPKVSTTLTDRQSNGVNTTVVTAPPSIQVSFKVDLLGNPAL